MRAVSKAVCALCVCCKKGLEAFFSHNRISTSSWWTIRFWRQKYTYFIAYFVKIRRWGTYVRVIFQVF